MARRLAYWNGLGAVAVLACAGLAWGQASQSATRPAAVQPAAWPVWPATHPAPLPKGMEDFKTTETCKTTTLARSVANSAGVDEPGYLGVAVEMLGIRLSVIAVAPDSPAAKAGFKPQDSIVSVEGHVPGTEEDFRDLVQSVVPGTVANIVVMRREKQISLAPVILPVSKPMGVVGAADRAVMGVSNVDSAAGARITAVANGSPAARADLRPGDVVVKVDNVTLSDTVRLADTLMDRKVDDMVSLLVDRNGARGTIKVQLAAAGNAATRGTGGAGNSTYYDRLGQIFKKDTLRLAIVGIEYPDVKHNPGITAKNWEDEIFSRNSYAQTATGQTAYGSEADYYYADSYGQLKVQGTMLPWVTVSKNRADYSQGSGTGQDRVLLGEATDLIVAKDKAALDNYDGILFVYAGNRVNTTRGSIYWPHKSMGTFANRRFPYVIIPEGNGVAGGARGGPVGGAPPTDVSPARIMSDISVVCHESGHILGLPDLYAMPENPGSIGVGSWCIMSQQAGNGRPQEMCAWCKEAMGWLRPVVIDPAVKQKLVLGAVEDSPTECYKVLLKADGSEYFLLENRVKKGFDASLPGEGLLIWRVIGNRPFLMESHGIEGPGSPQTYVTAVPYPSASNDSLTPFTTPSSRSPLGGGNQVYITNIKRMGDGRVSFWVGYAFE